MAVYGFEHRSVPYRVTINQGLAKRPDDGQTADELLAPAGKALDAAKAAGRNSIRAANGI